MGLALAGHFALANWLLGFLVFSGSPQIPRRWWFLTPRFSAVANGLDTSRRRSVV